MLGATAYKGQKYSSIKKQCLKSGTFFVDPEFPPNNKSLFFSKIDSEIEWKRPEDLCKVPKLVVEGVSCEDLNEGELGNTWFVSACSGLAQDPRLWTKVIPNHKEQEWGPDNGYAGIFHFQFWRYGQWVDVVIDDLLPTKNGRLVFCHSKSKNEFWSALLEKAYAKLYGDYESLESGFTADALVDFTGGVAERLDFSKLDLESIEGQDAMFNHLRESRENKLIIICNIACSKEDIGQEGDLGLVKGHGYGITNVLGIQVKKSMRQVLNKDKLHLVRLRNPWGTKEWTGPWSDNSVEWNALSQRDRESLGIKFEQEGEFWMCFDDFVSHFARVDICHFVNTSFFSLKKTWSEALLTGAWTMGAKGSKTDRAGGSRETSPRTFLYNPQYVFDINGLTDTVLLSLEQDDTGVGKQTGDSHLTIGFHVFKVEDNRQYRVHQLETETVAISEYINLRSVFKRISLKRGRYVVIPTTLEARQSGKYLLRMYCGGSHNARELCEESPKPGGLCRKPYAMVTRVNVISAANLDKVGTKQLNPNPFVVVRCEGDAVKSHTVRNKSDPTWNFQCIFYRKKLDQPITFELINQKALSDSFIGLATLREIGNEDPQTFTLDLYGKSKKEREVQRSGELSVQMVSSDDLTFF